MTPLHPFPTPFSNDGPPAGYKLEGRGDTLDDTDSISSETALSVVKKRDTFLGKPRCVVCGAFCCLERCKIIHDSDPKYWAMLEERHWIPSHTGTDPQYNPSNGILMCPNHQAYFENHLFFIRFMPNARKFVFVTYSDMPGDICLAPYHGKAIAIDVLDRNPPLPSLFILHENLARGANPFQPDSPELDLHDIKWQDWVYTFDVLDETSGSFKRDKTESIVEPMEPMPPGMA